MQDDHGQAAWALTQALLTALLTEKLVSPARLRSALAVAETRMHSAGKDGAAGLIAGLRAAIDDMEHGAG